MKALTLWQPWATLIAEGVKPFEFRSWLAPRWIWGQRIGIHAGARPVKLKEIDELIASLRLEEGGGTALKPEALDILLRIQAAPERLILSAVVCTGIIQEPVPAAEAVRQAYGENFQGDSDRIDHQVFGWPITDIERLEPPVPCRGAQGFWNWTAPAAQP